MKKWSDRDLGMLVAGKRFKIDHSELAGFVNRVSAALDPLDVDTRKVVLDEMIAATMAGHDPADRVELLARLHGLCAELSAEPGRAQRAMSLDAALEACGLMSVVLDIEERAKNLVLPEPTTAANTETLLMSYGYWFSPIIAATPEHFGVALVAAAHRNAGVARAQNKLAPIAMISDDALKVKILSFAVAWCRGAFARLEIGHKLAASLCLTDVPEDVEVRAPWEAWSLVVPDGLLGALARVWCVGTEPVFMVTRQGNFHIRDDASEEHAATIMLRALVRGACLALSNPDEFRKERQHAPSARAQHKSRRHGPPDLQQARFLLSAPVKVDLREHVANALSGNSHASPTVQFLVRGHWRNQAHGPKHALRKVIWVEPFWKGPEESRILLRQHRVEDSPKAT